MAAAEVEDAVDQEVVAAAGVEAAGEDSVEAVEVAREVAEDLVAAAAGVVVVDPEDGVGEVAVAEVVAVEAEPRGVASREERPSSLSHIVTRESSLPVARRTRWSR